MEFNLVDAMAKSIMGSKFGAMSIGQVPKTPGFRFSKPVAKRHKTLLPPSTAFPQHAVSKGRIGRKRTDAIERRRLVQNLMGRKGG